MPETITYLTTSFQEKELVKSLGAKWDVTAKKWYVPEGIDLKPFENWLANTHVPIINSSQDTNSIGLAELLSKVANVIVTTLPTAIWINAEISELKKSGEHLAIELVENDANGLRARVRSFLWKSNLTKVLSKFKVATGFELSTGIKAMLLVKVEFHAVYGVQLIIQDIDPTYTLGDIEAKLRHIRDNLIQEGIFTRNQFLPKPQEFCHIAVISPDGAAGLGDFKRDADILHQSTLCTFDYFSAKFQGANAAIEIRNCLLNIQQNNHHYDAICIIRGGGSVTDLYWLNDLELARTVCQSPLPVFTGIGHERDNTILDEVANTRFDTPSKVIAHIRDVICSNTHAALTNYQHILHYAQHQITWAEQANESLLGLIKNESLQQLNQLEYQVDKLAEGLQPAIHRLLSDTEAQLQQTIQFMESKVNAVIINAETITEQTYQSVITNGYLQLERATYQVESLGKEILGISPRSTLNRGFTLVRDNHNQPIVSATMARQQAVLNIEFRDGIVTVTPNLVKE
jgi:exodeoxyribonuclease VII large subunit